MTKKLFLVKGVAIICMMQHIFHPPTAVKCPPVPNPKTSKPDGFGKKAGVVINFTCKGKYPLYLSGEYSITCLQSGEWSDFPLECQGKDNSSSSSPSSSSSSSSSSLQARLMNSHDFEVCLVKTCTHLADACTYSKYIWLAIKSQH